MVRCHFAEAHKQLVDDLSTFIRFDVSSVLATDFHRFETSSTVRTGFVSHLISAEQMSIATDRLINAKVVCRIRPLTQSEKKAGGHSCIDYTTSCIEVFNSLGQHPFDCDHILDETSTQQDVFDYSARPHIDDALAGINSTIIAYGQTSSGKTYTIDGDPSNAIEMGIVPRTVIALFDAAAMRSSTMQFTLKMSYIEIYMEKVKDLLSEDSTSSADDQSTVKMIGVNVAEKKVSSFDQFMKHWKAGKSSTLNFASKSYICENKVNLTNSDPSSA